MEGVSSLKEIWRFREVIKNFVAQDLKVRYRRSFLGFFWSLLNPLLQMAVITLVFSMLFRFGVKSYALYVLSGLVPWTFIAASVDGCSMSIVGAESMIKRQYFPKLVFPLSVVAQNLITFVASLFALLCILAPFTDFQLSWAMLILPVSFILIVCVALGVGAIAAILTVHFRDVQHLIGVCLSLLFYLTPIIYPMEAKQKAQPDPDAVVVNKLEAGSADDATASGAASQPNEPEWVDAGPIPHQYRFYFKLNPMYSIIEMFHRPIYDRRLPTSSEFLSAFAVAAVSLGLGLYVFRRHENKLIFSL